MDDVDPRAVLATIPLFADTLDGEALDDLAAKTNVAYFPTGTFLVTEGEFGGSMFAIVEGKVAVTLRGAEGDERGVAKLGPGEIVGEIALMTGQRRSATAAADGDVVAVEIPKFALEEMFRRSPDLIDRFGAVLAGRQAQLRRIGVEGSPGHDIATQIRRFFARPRR